MVEREALTMLFKFWCKDPGRTELVIIRVLGEPMYITALGVARTELKTDELEVNDLPDDEEADIELEWRGSDTNGPGAPLYPRKLWSRRRVDGVLTAWEET